MAFYNSSQALILRLKLQKRNGLYYCPFDTIATDTSPVRPQISQTIINSYMDQISASLTDNDHDILSFSPSPSFHPYLPPISETTKFTPILDSLAEQPFHEAPPIFQNQGYVQIASKMRNRPNDHDSADAPSNRHNSLNQSSGWQGSASTMNGN